MIWMSSRSLIEDVEYDRDVAVSCPSPRHIDSKRMRLCSIESSKHHFGRNLFIAPTLSDLKMSTYSFEFI